MKLKHLGVAGTVESSDVLVTVEPGEGRRDLEIDSTVLSQFGKQIKSTVIEVLDQLEVDDAKIRIQDNGALDRTLKARVACAVFRSVDQTEQLPWREKL